MKSSIVIASTALLLFGACASRRVVKELVSSQAVPSAEGVVRIAREQNGNTQLQLRVSHLAQPSRLAPGASTYVVWARPSGTGQPMHNAGGLRLDDKLHAELDTVVPFASFDLFVTAEPSRGVTQPSGEPVLWTSVVQRTAE